MPQTKRKYRAKASIHPQVLGLDFLGIRYNVGDSGLYEILDTIALFSYRFTQPTPPRGGKTKSIITWKGRPVCVLIYTLERIENASFVIEFDNSLLYTNEWCDHVERLECAMNVSGITGSFDQLHPFVDSQTPGRRVYNAVGMRKSARIAIASGSKDKRRTTSRYDLKGKFTIGVAGKENPSFYVGTRKSGLQAIIYNKTAEGYINPKPYQCGLHIAAGLDKVHADIYRTEFRYYASRLKGFGLHRVRELMQPETLAELARIGQQERLQFVSGYSKRKRKGRREVETLLPFDELETNPITWDEVEVVKSNRVLKMSCKEQYRQIATRIHAGEKVHAAIEVLNHTLSRNNLGVWWENVEPELKQWAWAMNLKVPELGGVALISGK